VIEGLLFPCSTPKHPRRLRLIVKNMDETMNADDTAWKCGSDRVPLGFAATRRRFPATRETQGIPELLQSSARRSLLTNHREGVSPRSLLRGGGNDQTAKSKDSEEWYSGF
jgi:hypothetical protein